MRKVELQKAVSVDKDRARSLGSEHDRLAQSIRWLWYEFTPYEVGCDEIGGMSTLSLPHATFSSHGVAWIPSWALGRPFINGKNLERRVRRA